MNLSKEVKVGLLALVAGVILYVGFNFLKGYEIFSSTKTFYVVYEDIDGLTVSNPVTLNGLQVGRVQNIQLQTDKGNTLLVTINVDKEVPVGDSTFAYLSNIDLLSGKSIDLKIGRNAQIFEGGQTLPGYKKQDITEALTAKAMPILSNLDSTVVRLNRVLGSEMSESIKATMQNFEVASDDLKNMVATNKNNISAITGNLAALSRSLGETERSLKPILAKMSMVADSLNDMELKQTVHTANEALKNVQMLTNKINDNQGTLGRLVNDRELYDNLNKTAESLNNLTDDIQKNPRRYIKVSVF